jgi:putative hydrolase of the HAD superfamily
VTKSSELDPPLAFRLPPSGIKAVFFDAGATLLHPQPPVEEVYAREFSQDGARFSSEDFARALTRAWEEVHAESAADRYGGVAGEQKFWFLFLNRVRRVLDGGSVSAGVFERLARHFRDPRSWSVYDDVLPALDALDERGLRLAVVSNWDSYLPKLLEALGLHARFRTISVSAIEQVGKPDPEIFRRTCSRMNVAPGEVLHVGDSLAEDYEAARAAGLSAVLLDRTDRHPAVPHRIGSLSELTTLIAGG